MSRRLRLDGRSAQKSAQRISSQISHQLLAALKTSIRAISKGFSMGSGISSGLEDCAHAMLNRICRIKIRHTGNADLNGTGKALILLTRWINSQLVRVWIKVSGLKEGGDYPRVRSLTDATRQWYSVPIRLQREMYYKASTPYEQFWPHRWAISNTHTNETRLRFQMDEILSKGTHLTDGQYLIIITISATVLLVILQFLKRRLIRNESPDELYEDIAPALGRQINTHELGPIFIVQEDSSGSGNRHCPPVPFFRVIKFVQRSGQIAFRVVAEPNGRVNLHLDFCVSPSSEKENNHGR